MKFSPQNWGRFPICLIFFKGVVSTTNQYRQKLGLSRVLGHMACHYDEVREAQEPRKVVEMVLREVRVANGVHTLPFLVVGGVNGALSM